MVRATSFGKQKYGLWFEATQFFYSIMSMHKISPEAGGGGGGGGGGASGKHPWSLLTSSESRPPPIEPNTRPPASAAV